MDNENVIFIVGCAILGYVIVSLFLKKKETKNTVEDIKSAKDETTESSDKNQTKKEKVWFEVLEVSENCSIAELSLAYKKKISEYHPDKVSTMGIELKLLANDISKEINDAYQLALKLKK